jgi:cytochrome c-type biogenesis protein CcmH
MWGMRRAAIISGFLMAAVAVVSARGAGSKPTTKAIADGLICQCGGCNFPVGTCNHEQCASRDDMKAMAQKEIEAGKDEAAIFQDFVLRYGVKVLATPPASGFNLSVWILPVVGVVLGLAVAIVLARRWRRRRGGPDLPPGASAQSDPALLAAIEEEMRASGITG